MNSQGGARLAGQLVTAGQLADGIQQGVAAAGEGGHVGHALSLIHI